MEALDWDAYQSIRFRPDHALWRSDKLRFQAQFFHLGLFFKSPVRIYELADGQAQELAYVPEMFDQGQSGLAAARLPRDLGFAGFRLNFHTDLQRDVSAFLGSELLPRGRRRVAVRAFGARPRDRHRCAEARGVSGLHRLLARTAGSRLEQHHGLRTARFTKHRRRLPVVTPGDTQVMDIDAALYPRTAIDRLGIAACTSMFQVARERSPHGL